MLFRSLDQGFNSPAVEYLENRAVVSRVTMQHEPETIPFETVEADIRAEIAGSEAGESGLGNRLDRPAWRTGGMDGGRHPGSVVADGLGIKGEIGR